MARPWSFRYWKQHKRWINVGVCLAIMGVMFPFNGPGTYVARAAVTFTNHRYSSGLVSLDVDDIAASGSDVYAATINGLAISHDGGATFTNRTTTDGLGGNNIYSVAYVNDILYAGTAYGLSISTDGGQAFVNRRTDGVSGFNQIFDIAVVGTNVYVATNDGVGISHDGGSTFTTTRFPKENHPTEGSYIISVDAIGDSVYFGTALGIEVSHDGGQTFTWKTIDDGLASNFVYSIRAIGSTVYAGTRDGLDVSQNGGQTFAHVSAAGVQPIFGVDALGSNVYIGTGSGVGISSDGGGTFSFYQMADGLGSNFIYVTRLFGATLYAGTANGLATYSYPLAAPPFITAFPQSVTVVAGASVTFSASAAVADSGTVSYQWQKDEVDISGARSSLLTLSNVALSDAGQYRAIVINSLGPSTTSVSTASATLQVTVPATTVVTTTSSSTSIAPNTTVPTVANVSTTVPPSVTTVTTTLATNTSTSTTVAQLTSVTTLPSLLKPSAGTLVVIPKRPSTSFAQDMAVAVLGTKVTVGLKTPNVSSKSTSAVTSYVITLTPNTKKIRPIVKSIKVVPNKMYSASMSGARLVTYSIRLVAVTRIGKRLTWNGPTVKL